MKHVLAAAELMVLLLPVTANAQCSSLQAPVLSPSFGSPYEIALKDLDGDGTLEAVVTHNAGSNHVSVYTNPGNGSLTLACSQSYPQMVNQGPGPLLMGALAMAPMTWGTAAAMAQNQVYLCGGDRPNGNQFSTIVQILDFSTGTWSLGSWGLVVGDRVRPDAGEEVVSHAE